MISQALHTQHQPNPITTTRLPPQENTAYLRSSNLVLYSDMGATFTSLSPSPPSALARGVCTQFNLESLTATTVPWLHHLFFLVSMPKHTAYDPNAMLQNKLISLVWSHCLYSVRLVLHPSPGLMGYTEVKYLGVKGEHPRPVPPHLFSKKSRTFIRSNFCLRIYPKKNTIYYKHHKCCRHRGVPATLIITANISKL